jgi:predicted outer membrane repeat protein
MVSFFDSKSRRVVFGLIILSCGFCLSCSDDKPASPDLPDAIINVPSEMPTILAAVNAAADGDTILVAPGIYSGEGNCDITITGKSVAIISETGCANTIIDCQGIDTAQHRAFFISGQESSNTIIEGFTIKGGYNTSGAAVYCISTSPTFKFCIFSDNLSTLSGGAIRCKNSSPTLINCTFVANSAKTGGAIFGLASSSPYLENCIIAFSGSGGSIATGDGSSQPLLACCNIFGNAGGDWVASISNQANSEGNLSVDPLFCDFDRSLFFIDPNSPCAPENNSCGQLIGALPAGCN